MKYSCGECLYSTDVKCNYDKHLNSIRHKKMMERPKFPSDTAPMPPQVEDPKVKKLTCPYCETCFVHIANLSRHKKSCSEKTILIESYERTITDLRKDHEKQMQERGKEHERQMQERVKDHEKQMQDLIKDYEGKLLVCKNENLNQIVQMMTKDKESFQRIAETSTETHKTTWNTLSYLTHTFKQTPRCQLFVNIPQSNDPDDPDKDARIAMYEYKNKTIGRYVGDMIIKEYKTENPSDQTFWNSDTTRNSYVVREGPSDALAEWISDKTGKKVSMYTMSPVLNAIKERVKKFTERTQQMIDKGGDHSKLLPQMDLATHLLKDIDSGVIGREIHRYISAYFYFDKNKHIKRLPSGSSSVEVVAGKVIEEEAGSDSED